MEHLKGSLVQSEKILMSQEANTITNEYYAPDNDKILNLPDLFLGKGFKNFICEGLLKEKMEACKKFAFGQSRKNSLVLCGKIGNGKTHLAVAVMKNLGKIKQTKKNAYNEDEIFYKNPNRIFLIADEFFMELNDAVNTGKSKLNIITDYLNKSDICLLDDLGVKNFSSAKQENLYTFINRAYLYNKRIILTTNFMLEDFDEFDSRISSRLNEMAEIIIFDFDDYRLGQI